MEKTIKAITINHEALEAKEVIELIQKILKEDISIGKQFSIQIVTKDMMETKRKLIEITDKRLILLYQKTNLKILEI